MKKDTSFGIVPLKREGGEWYVLIVHQSSGYWGFPKGHKEPGEEDRESARRELQEETSLLVKEFLPIGPYIENYKFLNSGGWIDKTVHLYPALVEGEIFLNQLREVSGAKWVPLASAASHLTYPQAQTIILQTLHGIKSC